MGALNRKYPRDLGKVVSHAKRLIKVLTKLEQTRSERWFLGRAGELRGVVSLALSDWRGGASDAEKAAHAIRSYLDALHRGAAKKLRCGVALECCEPDDVITAVGLDHMRSGVGTNTGISAARTPVTSGPTVRTGWVDSPEILARVRQAFGLVEVNARMVMRRIGEATATIDDLCGYGHEGLLDAARAFDEDRGVPFDRWASLRIRSAMIDGVRRWGRMPARVRQALRELEEADSALVSRQGPGESNMQPGREALEASTDASLATGAGNGSPAPYGEGSKSHAATPEEAAAKAQLASMLRDIMDKLPSREREVIDRTYFKGQSLEEAAASMGVSRWWAGRAHARAIEIMQREVRKREAGASGATKTKPSRPKQS